MCRDVGSPPGWSWFHLASTGFWWRDIDPDKLQLSNPSKQVRGIASASQLAGGQVNNSALKDGVSPLRSDEDYA